MCVGAHGGCPGGADVRRSGVLVTRPSPRRSLRWFRRFRYTFLPVLALGGVLERFGDASYDGGALAQFLLVALALEILDRALVTRFGPSAVVLPLQVALTLGQLAGGAWLLRAADHPGLDMLVQFVVPCALTLSPPMAWVSAVLLIGVHNGLVLYGPRVGSVELDVFGIVAARQLQQLLVFDASVVALTLTVIRVRDLLNDREARLHAALEDHARDERFVSLGILSAGIAHELGTPLSSIDLLASEALADPESTREALTTLRGQVQRCREILDRLRGGTAWTVSNEVEAFGPCLRRWVADWQSAGLDRGQLRLEVAAGLELLAVAGDPDTWRGIVWSLLDNAARAGFPIVVRADAAGDVLLEIDDGGQGPTAQVIAQAGEAFHSRWGDGGREGRGLALFVATSFARRWGGDVRLSRRPGGGGRVAVRLATIPREAS